MISVLERQDLYKYLDDGDFMKAIFKTEAGWSAYM